MANKIKPKPYQPLEHYKLAMPSLELIYVNSPRCASTTTLNIFRDKLDIEPEVEENFGKYKVHALFFSDQSKEIDVYRHIENAPEDYLSFTVVRNPFARVVSFFDAQSGNGESSLAVDWYNHVKGDSFKDYVKKIYNLGIKNFEEHLMEQYRGLQIEQIDKLVHLENYEEGIKEIIDIEDVPHWREGSSREKKYPAFYDKETREMVRELYAKDLEKLDYEF